MEIGTWEREEEKGGGRGEEERGGGTGKETNLKKGVNSSLDTLSFLGGSKP